MGLFSAFKNLWRILWGGSSNTITSTTTTDSTTSASSSNKKCGHIGINDYPGTNNDLRGCVNDARNWMSLLKSYFSFTVAFILLDKDASKKGVKTALNKLVSESKTGDELVVTYSGHGTSVPDSSGDEGDGKDEAWCLYDGLMIDDEIQAIIGKLPSGVKLTIISDSCFSGTVSRAFMGAMDSNEYCKARYMPPEDIQEAILLNTMPVKKAVFTPRAGMKEILISGCSSSEYSYDARINGQNVGAFSYYAIDILKNNTGINYKDFHKKLRKILPSSSYPQSPQLEGSEAGQNSIMFK